jgi:hypothetical protein
LGLTIAAVLLVGVLGVGGFFVAKRNYLPTKPLPLPEAGVAPEVADEVRQRVDTFADAAAETPPAATDSAAAEASPVQTELTAADINALIERNPKSRGVASVSIEGNTARVQISLPLNRLDRRWRDALGLQDHYFNAQFSVPSPAGGDPGKLQLTDVTINGHTFPGDALDWSVVGRSPRDFAREYADEYHISKFQITNGKVILHSGR